MLVDDPTDVVVVDGVVGCSGSGLFDGNGTGAIASSCTIVTWSAAGANRSGIRVNVCSISEMN